jgi:hypothetical protein
MSDLVVRFFAGGVIVSLFAVLGDVVRPKSFAGLFGAAPAVALATIGITITGHGRVYAAIEARSMMIGAIAFLIYAAMVSWVLRRYKPGALKAALAAMPLWLGVSLGLGTLICRGIW